jgi:nucleotide-binding universal stress UspA family protein
MYDTIVVPLDGSPAAEFALPPALAMAERTGARIVLLSVVPGAPFHAPAGFGSDPPRGWHEEEFRRLSRYLEGVERRVEGSGSGVPMDREVDSGPPVRTLAERIRALEADLVVMTTHGRGPLHRAWLGSVADGLLRRGPAPILLVRAGEGEVGLSDRPGIRRILVLLDGSDLSESAIPGAAEVARSFGARISLATVVPPPFAVTSPYVPSVVEDSETREAIMAGFRRYLEAMAGPVDRMGIPTDTAVVKGRDVVSGILEHRDRIGADLVVMCSRGRSGAARLILGSVTDKVVRSAPVPVLVHPPPGQEAAVRD